LKKLVLAMDEFGDRIARMSTELLEARLKSSGKRSFSLNGCGVPGVCAFAYALGWGGPP